MGSDYVRSDSNCRIHPIPSDCIQVTYMSCYVLFVRFFANPNESRVMPYKPIQNCKKYPTHARYRMFAAARCTMKIAR